MAGPDLQQLMQQAMQMQQKMQAAQETLKDKEVHGSAVGGKVKITMTGDMQVKSVHIDPELREEPVDMLEDLVRSATNQALKAAQELAQSSMAGVMPPELMGGKIPGF